MVTVAVVLLCGSRAAARAHAPAAPPAEIGLAHAVRIDRLSPAEAVLMADAADGRLDTLSPLEAAWLAADARPRADLVLARQRLEGWLADLRQSPAVDGPALQRLNVLLTYLHERVLTGAYRTDASDPRVTLLTGDYNCLSSLVILASVAGPCGVPLEGRELPGHVVGTVHTPTGPWRVETTARGAWAVNPWARSTGTASVANPDAAAAGGAIVGPAAALGAAPDAPLEASRPLDPLALVALVYYNRGVEELERGDDLAAVTSNLRALQLDPTNGLARANLRAAVNNAALAACRAGQHEQAAAMLAEAVRRVPEHRTFWVNLAAVHQRWAKADRRRGDSGAADARIAAVVRELPGLRPLLLPVGGANPR